MKTLQFAKVIEGKNVDFDLSVEVRRFQGRCNFTETLPVSEGSTETIEATANIVVSLVNDEISVQPTYNNRLKEKVELIIEGMSEFINLSKSTIFTDIDNFINTLI